MNECDATNGGNVRVEEEEEEKIHSQLNIM